MKFKNFLPKRNQQEGELKIQFCNARYVHKLQHPWSKSLCKLEVETKEFSDFRAILFLDIHRFRKCIGKLIYQNIILLRVYKQNFNETLKFLHCPFYYAHPNHCTMWQQKALKTLEKPFYIHSQIFVKMPLKCRNYS